MPVTDFLSRSAIYRQLYLLFHYPEELPAPAPGIKGWAPLFSLIEGAAKAGLEALQVEYVRLFEYRPKCSPLESAWRKEVRREAVLSDILDLYRRAGLHCSPSMIPDHVAVELEFMHFLAFSRADRVGKLEEEGFLSYQRRFAEDHLLLWLPAFCRCLKDESRLDFFREAASLTIDFVKGDIARLRGFTEGV
jgi:TorA maturation chaperone TorD